MTNILPFEFESHAVRVCVGDVGQPWFNANDVCAVLEFGNPRQAIESHVDDDDVQKLDTIDALGRTQRTNHVNESGLYALILGSTKDSAKRFKRWVTSEVLPAIRKTGGYNVITSLPAATQDRVSSILLIGQAVAKVPGVKAGIAMAATLNCIAENTGIAVETLRRALPAADAPICSLNATQVGQLLGISAKAANQRLARHELQVRNDRDEWELTEAGEAWAEAMPYSRNGHSGYQILWNAAVADLLKEAA
ncbi:BRO domain-containing protein [Burkholderia pseudomallei]|uniref:BRO-N domain-containing protein n=1 Tax=Burkholderia pseudomallei TaxID=28450 RepID=UPI00097569F7|nr:Bro-N domain-containing protein [Burkholderia pseudomallei]OMS46614.1 antirepressor [Burkholderia pseudomallei]CAJ3062373.1 BRO domain-containing protein [Burkholderia pseudomallei]CAJ3070825.1 BRO domain-containing protein [Burkholderia pseudomallei]CAJ3708412.1 BRO domain-containing protein [Burkholderia pseudomallei]CAJ3725195.1 BRO domain-containing protein [Burkholderia pseudomallei]